MNAPMQIPAHDPAAIAKFAQFVFEYLEGFVPIRMFAEKGTPNQKPLVKFCTTDEAAAQLERLAPWAAQHGRALYVVPGTTAQTSTAEAKDIVQTSVVVIDLDRGDVVANRDMLIKHLGPPSLEVASGGLTDRGVRKLHLYWRLTEAASGDDLERVRRLRETIARKACGDPSFDSMHQPIRVPGSIHGKHRKFAPVEILVASDREYELHDLETAVAAIPDPPPVAPAAGGKTPHAWRLTAGELATKVIREDSVDGITRFAGLSSVIGHWVRNVRLGHVSPNEAWKRCPRLQHRSDQTSLGGAASSPRVRRDRSEGRREPWAPASGTRRPQRKACRAPVERRRHCSAFVAAEGEDWRYVPSWSKWLTWQGTHWAIDETNLIRERVRQACRDATRDLAEKPAEARRIASNKTISAVVAIAAADPVVSRAPDAWDQHPMLLNTPSGTIDLGTGECRGHDRREAITQITRASLGGQCHRWREFLEQITDGDDDLQGYLQRLAGYCLTGKTDEQVFAFLHGSGANGKSVFLSTLGRARFTYTATAALGTFTKSKSDRHLTELAGLRAARLVLVSETEAGRSWDEARIKTITGGERIRANFMRQDHFEFTPQFKLLVAGNHRPALHGVGEAMRRRLHVVPFDVTIPGGPAGQGSARQAPQRGRRNPGLDAGRMRGMAGQWPQAARARRRGLRALLRGRGRGRPVDRRVLHLERHCRDDFERIVRQLVAWASASGPSGRNHEGARRGTSRTRFHPF
jgi:putative DNA primase/helicase